MRNLEVRICKCGRIHFIPFTDIEDAINENKELLVICSNCGSAHRYGADDYFDEGKALYCLPLDPIDKVDITKEEFNKNFTKILYNNGIRVPMKTGQFADAYLGGVFYDCNPYMWHSKIYEARTVEEIREYYEKQKELSCQVNVRRLRNSLTDVQKEAIDNYYIKAFQE